MKYFSKTITQSAFATLFFLSSGVASAQSTSNAVVQDLGWGGGGVFTSIVKFEEHVYASSDVSGVWKLTDNHWVEANQELTNYDVTGLFVHADKLFAVNRSQIQFLDENSIWQSLNVSIATERNTSSQLNSTSSDGTTCIAGLENKITCILPDLTVENHVVGISKLSGIYFDAANNDTLYGFYQKNLYKIDLNSNTYTVDKTFGSSIKRIVNLSGSSDPVVFTTTDAYNIATDSTISIQGTTQKVLNVFPAETISGQNFIALGTTWSAKVYKFEFTGSDVVVGDKVSIGFDKSLPYRKWKAQLNKPLGIVNLIDNEFWFGDYWGIFKYDHSVGKFVEMSKNAANYVASDMVLTGDSLIVSSMDNGLVKVNVNTNSATTIFPRTGSDWQLAGHAWGIAKDETGIYATLSPWNLPNDYLVSMSEDGNFKAVNSFTNVSSRYQSGAFWGNSYPRKLLKADSLYTYKDGSGGGLYKLDVGNAGDVLNTTKVFETDKNRVFNGLASMGNLIFSSHIDGVKKLVAHDKTTGDIVDEVVLPAALWAFSLEVINEQLYILGTESNAVAYRYDNGTITKIAESTSGGVFHSIAEASAKNTFFISSISWNNKNGGRVLMKRAEDSEFVDISCLLGNNNGAIKLIVDENEDYLYVLQYVGGIKKILIDSVDASTCASF